MNELIKYKKGEMIFGPGDKPGKIGRVKSGLVKAYIVGENGQEIAIPWFRPLYFWTLAIEMTGMENKLYFEAMVPTEIVWATDEPTEAEAIKETMGQLMRLVTNFVYLMSDNSYGKVARMVAVLDEINRSKEYKKEKLAVTHKLIAQLTGLTRETVTLQMIKLEKEKIIDNKGRKVVITDREGLIKVIKQARN